MRRTQSATAKVAWFLKQPRAVLGVEGAHVHRVAVVLPKAALHAPRFHADVDQRREEGVLDLDGGL